MYGGKPNFMSVSGLHLRHIIPYSDIAGVLYVATTDSTRIVMGERYVEKIRERVAQLIRLLQCGAQAEQQWEELRHKEHLLTNSGHAKMVKELYRALAHSQNNLFPGDGSSNLTLSNRLDIPMLGIGGHHDLFIQLGTWWWETMNELFMEPRFYPEKVAVLKNDEKMPNKAVVIQHLDDDPDEDAQIIKDKNFRFDHYEEIELYSHIRSRALRPVFREGTELRMVRLPIVPVRVETPATPPAQADKRKERDDSEPVAKRLRSSNQ
jgi:hypothetical protein